MCKKSIFVLLLIAVLASPLLAQPTWTLDLGAATGGNTNDVQFTYGTGLELLRRGRLTVGAEFVYVRDFFEFEPDTPIDDARIYTDVLGGFGTAHLWLRARGNHAVEPYFVAGPGWLRARAFGRTSDQFAISVGAGLALLGSSRVGLRVDARHFAALSGEGTAAPQDSYSFWRTGITVTVALGKRRSDDASTDRR